MDPLTPTVTTDYSNNSHKYFHLTAAGYTPISRDFSQSKFSIFRQNSVYLFPILMKQKYSPSNELLIKSNKLMHASETDIEETLKNIKKNSPFTNQDAVVSSTEKSLFDDNSQDELQFSQSEKCSAAPIRLSRPLTIDSAFAADSTDLKALSKERFSILADNASIISEGIIQAVPNFPDSLSAKNPLNINPVVDLKMIRIPEKELISIFPSVTCEESYSSYTWESFFSPISVKSILCEGESSSLSVLNTFTFTGFIAAPTLEFSEIETENKGAIVLEPEKIYISMMSQSVLECIGKTSVAFMTFGYEHVMLLTSSGKIMTWGYGGSGCLGHNNTQSQSYPLLISDLLHETFAYVESGAYHCIAVSEKGEVYSWGRGDVHQTGIPSKYLSKDDIGFYSSTPNKLSFFHNIKIVSGACGEAHTLLLDSEGKVYSFGWGEDGQLGISRHLLNTAMISTQANILQALLALTVIKVRAGNLFSACLTSRGEVYVWGNGEQGQLGQGRSFVQSDFPIKVEGLQDVLDIQCGESHVICVDNKGKLWGWGAGRAVLFQDSNFPDGSEITCYSPKLLNEVESTIHFKLESPSSPSMILPNIDYQERISELAEQLRMLYGNT